MPRVTYRNVFEDQSEFKEIDAKYLIGTAYEYARQESDEIYNAVLGRKVAIFINNKPIPVDEWAIKKVEENDEIIIVSRLHGGTKKLLGFLMAAAGIAIMAFAPEIAALGFIQALNITAGQVFLFGVSLALSGITGLFFTSDLPKLPSIGGGRETPTYNWGGIQTTARPDIAIPIVYGTCAVGGNIISAHVEVDGNDNYLHMLLALCEGEIDGICQLTDHSQICTTSDRSSSFYKDPAIFINDQPLSNYDEVEWWYRTGTNEKDTAKDEYYPFAQNPIPRMSNAMFQVTDGREIGTDWIEYTTQHEVDSVTLNIRADALYRIHESDFDPCEVKYKIQAKTESEAEWHDVTIKRYEPKLAVLGLWQEDLDEKFDVSYQDGSTEKHDYKRPSYTIQFVNVHNDPRMPMYAWYTIKDEDGNLIENEHPIDTHGRGHISPYYHSTGLNTYRTIKEYKVFIPADVRNNMRIKLYSDESEVTEFSIKAASKTPVNVSNTIDFKYSSFGSGLDTYIIRIARITEPSNSHTVADTIKLDSVIETIYGNFIYPNTALLGLRIKATGQLSGGIPSVKTIIRGLKIPVPLPLFSPSLDNYFYNENLDRYEDANGNPALSYIYSSWDDRQYTENSMLCVRDLLTNTRYGVGRYITDVDLYTSGLERAINLCHKKWNKTSATDYLSWFKGGSDREFNNHWSLYPSMYGNAVGYPSIRQIGLTGRASAYSIMFYLNKSLSQNISHTLSTTISGYSSDLQVADIRLYGYVSPRRVLLGEKSGIRSDGTYTITFTTPAPGIDRIWIDIGFPKWLSWSSSTEVDIKITGVSLTENTASSFEHFHTFNGVLDSKQEVMTALSEMCDSFRCLPIWLNGKFNFVIDEDESPIHLVSMGDMKEFSQTFLPLSEIPYKIYGQYLDKDDNYRMRQLVARTTDSSIPKTREKTIGLKGITDRKRAEREIKFRLNKSTNLTHLVKFKCGVDKLHATAGDIIYVQHQLPSWGAGGRLLGQTGKTLTLDEAYTFEDTSYTYLIKYLDSDNSIVNATIDLTGISDGDTVQSVSVASLPAIPADNSIYAIGKAGGIKPFRLLTVVRNTEHEVEVSAIEHLSSIYESEDIVVVDDNYSDLALPNLVKRPNPLQEFTVTQTDRSEGLGFMFYVETCPGDDIKDIIIEWSTVNIGTGFTTLLVLGSNQKVGKYIDPNLTIGKKYYFRAYCRSSNQVTSRYSYNSIILWPHQTPSSNPVPPLPISTTAPPTASTSTSIPYPTGIHIVGRNTNSMTFDSRDVTIAWNPVGTNPGYKGIVVGYIVEVYHDSPSSSNLLRTVSTSSETYTYSYISNMSDSPTGIPYKTLVFKIYTKMSDGTLSVGSPPFKITNLTPPTPSGLSTSSNVGGVMFSWTPSTAQDHEEYKYRFRVGGTEYTSWSTTFNTHLTYSLTASQIETYSNTASVTLFLRDVDAFNQESSTASITGIANTITDYTFNQGASSSGGSGNVASLYDGIVDSGGLTI